MRSFGDLIPVMSVGVLLAALTTWVLVVLRKRRWGLAEALRRSVLDALLVCAALPVLYLVLVPIVGMDGTPVSLVPGADLLHVIDEARLWQLLGNLLLLAPLGALAPLRWSHLRSMARVAITAAGVAVSIEAAQWLLDVGRVVSTDDALVNTAGAILGATMTRLWWVRARDRQNSSIAEHAEAGRD